MRNKCSVKVYLFQLRRHFTKLTWRFQGHFTFKTLCGTKGEFCTLMKRNQTVFLKLCLADALIKLMAAQDYDSINVNAICELAGVGRTTFYRHLDSKNGKEELLIFKINYEWSRYADLHQEDVEKDRGFALICFIYENRRLLSLLHDNGTDHGYHASLRIAGVRRENMG